MREAVHIFLKDSRYLRVPIAIVLAWTGIFLVAVATPLQPFPRLDGWLDAFGFVVPNISNYVLPAGWWFLISRAFHAEAIPGDRQFWLTRPYRRVSLWGAKTLFVLAYITLPLAIAQAAGVVFGGFPLGPSIPGLLWSQVLVLSIVVLPAAALAAMTSKLTQFVAVSIAVLLLFRANGLLGRWGALEWIRASIAIGLMVSVASTVLFLQFTRRRTGASRLIALAGILALVITLAFLPWRTAFALQSLVGSNWDGHLTAELVKPQPREGRRFEAMGPLTFQLAGPPAGTPIVCEAAEATIEGPGGTWRTGAEILRTQSTSKIEDGCALTISDAFISQVGTRPVNIKAILYVTVFGAEGQTQIPIDQAPTIVAHGVLCSGATRREFIRSRGETLDRSVTFVGCQSAFRDPRGLFLALLPLGSELNPSRFSYSPFPADLRIPPVEYVGFFNSRPVEVMTLATREPVAHVRALVDVRNVPLQDFLR